MHIKDIMSSNTCTCKIDTTLDKIAMMMWDNDCGAVPIVDNNNHPIGMVTDRDIAIGAAIKNKPLFQISAKEINNDRPVFTCNFDDDVKEVLSTMQKEKIRRIPIVNSRHELCGMVSIGDIAEYSEQKRGAKISAKETINTLKAVVSHHDNIHRSVAVA
jgi:CBS domain-containing protein